MWKRGKNRGNKTGAWGFWNQTDKQAEKQIDAAIANGDIEKARKIAKKFDERKSRRNRKITPGLKFEPMIT